MQNFRQGGFIMSYPPLLKLPITVSEKSFIELVLSFTDRGNTFYMNYNDIATYIGFKRVQSVKNLVFNLRRIGYITSKHSHNYNGSTGGSSTSIVVNEDFINNQLALIEKDSDEAIIIEMSIGFDGNEDNPSMMEPFSTIDGNNTEDGLEYCFEKISIMINQNDIIRDLANDFIPIGDALIKDDKFYKDFENHLKNIFKTVILERNDLKEEYTNIELNVE